MEGKEIFIEHGGNDYRYIPCLNNSPAWINALHAIAADHMANWPLTDEPAAVLAKRNALVAVAEAHIANPTAPASPLK
jgi:ferrochelatase